MKSMKDVHNKIAEIASQDPTNCVNYANVLQHILHNTVRNNKKTVLFSKVADTLVESCARTPASVSFTRLHGKLRALYKQFQSLTKVIDRNCEAINYFLLQVFEIPESDEPWHIPAPLILCPATPPTQLHTEPLHIPVPGSPSPPSHLSQPLTSTPVKTRQDCQKCPSMKKVNYQLRQSNVKDKSKIRQLFNVTTQFKKVYKVKAKEEKLMRHERKIRELKQKIRTSKGDKNDVTRKLRKATNALRILRKAANKWQKEKQKLLQHNAGLEEMILSLEAVITEKNENLIKNLGVIDHLESKLKDHEESIKKTICEDNRKYGAKSGKAYSVDVRRCLYYELQCDVPVSRCGELISFFVDILCGKEMDSVPSQSTCAQMAYELGVLSTCQLMEFILKENHLCLSWDATTVDGSHINEIHVTANKVKCLVLDVQHLPGGKTADYVTHIMSALTEAAATYSRYKGKSQEEIFKTVKNSISCTLTDRAAVNGCVTRQLCEEMDSQLLQLNCNVHPLDSVARHVKIQLKQLDLKHNIKGHCFGNEGCATNLINAISILRFKDGTGDPSGFKNFLRENDLPVGTFIRYVGNRLHVVFHLAGLIILHRDKLGNFIQEKCTAAGLIRASVLRDIKNDHILTQIWAMAVLGKVFSGPWMRKFYSSEMSNLEMAPLVQGCVQTLEAWLKDIGSLLLPTYDVFGNNLDPQNDPVLSSLLEYDGEESGQLEALKAAFSGTLSVLERQLSVFLGNGDFSAPSMETIHLTASAPTHNMASERTLGCLDKMWRRAPNATLGFLNGKVRFKMNKVMKWLEVKGEEERNSLIMFAINEAQEQRTKAIIRNQRLNEDKSIRRKDVSDERKKVKKRSYVKQINAALLNKNIENLTVSDSLKSTIELFMNEPNSLIGNLLMYSDGPVEWYGRIHRIIKSNKSATKIEVGYWTLAEAESNSVDYTAHVSSFFADIAVGYVVFL